MGTVHGFRRIENGNHQEVIAISLLDVAILCLVLSVLGIGAVIAGVLWPFLARRRGARATTQSSRSKPG